MEATLGVHGVHARVRQLLSSLEDMLRSSASAAGWAQSEDARAMKASIMTLMRQVLLVRSGSKIAGLYTILRALSSINK